MALDNKLGYTHFFSGQVPLDWNWENKAKFNLITNVLELHQILSENKGKMIAVDTETTGLDLGMDKIVGFSFSFDEWKGYYVPLRHEEVSRIETEVPKVDKEGNKVLYKKTGLPQMKKITLEEYTPYDCNLDPKVSLDLLYESMLNAKLVLMHNAIFDSMMIKKEDYDMSKINLFDTLCCTFNADTNASGQFGLKPASELFLGRRAQKFKEVLGKSKTFQYINPTDCFEYACSDAINTYGLFKKLYPMLRAEGCENILKMDNALVKSFINYYTSVPIYIDKKVMRKYEEEILRRKKDLEMSIYKVVGYPFNIASKSNELVKALESMGIDTGVKTDGGKMSTSKDSLLAIADKYPIARELIELSGLEKALNTYIHKLANANSVSDENPDVGICRVNYKLFGTASGRLASGGGAKSKVLEDDYFINLNIQNLTKPKPAMYSAVKISDDFREGILGYRFDLLGKPGSSEVADFITNNKDAYIIEGFSPEINVRKAIRVKDDTELIASLDYAAQEIRLAGILSGEPNFIQPFLEGKDVHTEMAKKLFGEANYTKEKRKAAKVANFGLLYGGSPPVLQAVAKAQGLILTDKEAKELFNKWWKTNSILKSWIATNLDLIKDNNFTTRDMFGRPRRVKHYLCSEEKGVYNFGARTIPSHQIQGSGSSIMRRLLINLEKKVFNNPTYKDRARYVSSVHDECNVAFKKENIVDDVRMLEDMMIYNPKGFPIPIDCSIELGTDLGTLFPFIWETPERLKLIPKRA